MTNEAPEPIYDTEGYEAVPYRTYTINKAALNDVESIVEFLGELGMNLNLFGDTTLEAMGKNPKFWVEVDAAPTTI